jgi:WXG100 family type VII secretion target
VTVVGEVSAADGALQRGAKIVIGAAWQGRGSAAFQQTFSAWQDKSRRITNALDEFEHNLLESQTAYTATDDASESSQKKFMGRLG